MSAAYYFLLLALSASICSAANQCDSWWSLGINSISQGDSLISDGCSSLPLTESQTTYCESRVETIKAIAVGVRKGIVQCQEQFAEAKWNCTTFVGDNLFGAFIANDTRETAVVDSLLAATASIEVAAACRNEELLGCTCKIDGINGQDEDGNFITYDCAHDTATSAVILDQFLQCSNGSIISNEVRNHNYDAGFEITKETPRSCRCTGYSGSCAVQSCYSKSLDIEVIGGKIRALYETAVQVLLSTTEGETELVPKNENASPVRTEDLVYIGGAVDFCEPNPAQGILGTKDRECDPSPSSSNSCGVLCCGRGAYHVVTQVPVEECKFVWCCRIECTITHYEEVSTYYCN